MAIFVTMYEKCVTRAVATPRATDEADARAAEDDADDARARLGAMRARDERSSRRRNVDAVRRRVDARGMVMRRDATTTMRSS